MDPRPGPDAPPPEARTVEITTWGGGAGTFWQLGQVIGLIWRTMPDWGMMTPPFRASHWELVSEEVAARYFDTMESHY